MRTHCPIENSFLRIILSLFYFWKYKRISNNERSKTMPWLPMYYQCRPADVSSFFWEMRLLWRYGRRKAAFLDFAMLKHKSFPSRFLSMIKIAWDILVITCMAWFRRRRDYNTGVLFGTCLCLSSVSIIKNLQHLITLVGMYCQVFWSLNRYFRKN